MDPAARAVIEANQRFYDAFERLDLAAMQELWLREPYVSCVHPGWAPLFGWGAVMESWQGIFEHTLAMKFTLTNLQVQTRADTAWVLVTENIDTRQESGWSSAVVQATNLFERRGGAWYLVHHHGSPVARPEEARQLQ